MDVLGVLLIYLHSPLGTACLWVSVCISVKPLTAMLHYIIVSKIVISYKIVVVKTRVGVVTFKK